VPAAEDDPSPIDFTIAQDVASQVALHFHTSALSDVTFTTGKLELSFEVVQQVTVESSVTEATGDLAVDAELYADPSADYAAALDVASTESLAVSLRSLSDWSFATATAICKSASVTSFGFSSPGLERRLAEVASDSARVCIFDDGDNDVVQIAMQRNGSAPVEQQSFLPNADYSFVMDLLMPVGDVFDGATLKQSALAGPVTVVGGNFDNAIFEAGTELAFANGALSGSVQLLP
jgi:hypothetical protein